VCVCVCVIWVIHRVSGCLPVCLCGCASTCVSIASVECPLMDGPILCVTPCVHPFKRSIRCGRVSSLAVDQHYTLRFA